MYMVYPDSEPAPEIRTVARVDFLPDSGEDSRCESRAFDDEEEPPDAFTGIRGESGFGRDKGREDAVRVGAAVRRSVRNE